MSKLLQVIILVCAILFSEYGFSQKKGYIVKGDTSLTTGKIFFDPNKPDKVKIRIHKGKIAEYTASQVSEFGLLDGTKFYAKSVVSHGTLKKLFIEEVETGKLVLYRLQEKKTKKVFIEDDTLLLINSENYQRILHNYANPLPKWREQYLFVKPTLRSISYFVRNYNRDKEVNIPFFSFGFMAGYSFTNLVITHEYFTPFNQGKLAPVSLSSAEINMGMFFEVPVWNINNLALQTQLSVYQNEYIDEFFSPFINQDIRIKSTHLKAELTPKYSFNGNSFRPYVLGGISFSYAVSNKSEVFQAFKDNSLIILSQIYNSISMPTYYYGAVYGFGISYFYKYDQYLSLEIRNNHLLNSNSALNNISILLKVNW